MISLHSHILSDTNSFFFYIAYGLIFAYTCYRSPWSKLVANLGLQHLCFGATVLLMIIWSIKADINEAVSIHFLGMTALTLVLGWDLAIVCASVALAMLTFLHGGNWSNFSANAVITILLPVMIAQSINFYVNRHLPKNFFVYLFCCGFFCAGLTAAMVGLGVAFTLWVTDIYPLLKVQQDIMTVIVLTIFPEGLLNGILLTAIMVFYPDWIRSFDAKKYIDDQ